MMDQDRNLGVTEARFALTIVICLLVAVGYVALLRLGGTGKTTVDDGTDGGTPTEVVQIEPTPVDNSNDPEVLKVDPPTGIMSTRPEPPKPLRSELPPNNLGFPASPPTLPVDSVDSQRR
jgi:hypothetical protein